jgi:outer membrane receptor protein involved in Fe transport
VTFEDILDFADDEVLTINARVDPLTGLSSGTYRHFRSKEFGMFIQDDWKVTPRLTLNLGVRYDNFGTLKETDDRLSTLVFDALATGRVVAVEDLYPRDNNNWAPRLGLAWDPTGKGSGPFVVSGLQPVWANLAEYFNTPYSCRFRCQR